MQYLKSKKMSLSQFHLNQCNVVIEVNVIMFFRVKCVRAPFQICFWNRNWCNCLVLLLLSTWLWNVDVSIGHKVHIYDMICKQELNQVIILINSCTFAFLRNSRPAWNKIRIFSAWSVLIWEGNPHDVPLSGPWHVYSVVDIEHHFGSLPTCTELFFVHTVRTSRHPVSEKAALHLGQSNTLKSFLLLSFMVSIPVLVANPLTESVFPNESKNISN